MTAAVNDQLMGADFDVAGRQLRIDKIVAPIPNIATNLNHIFAAKFSGDGIDLAVFLGIENNLCFPIAVPDVDKHEVFAVVTVTVDPAAESSGLVDMVTTKFAAGVSSKHS